MKNIGSLWIGVLLLVLSACAPQTEYTNALPKDAAVMMAVDLPSMALKAGLDGDAGEEVSDKLADFLKGGLEGEAAKLAERLVKSPSESGLSLNHKVYVFATPHGNTSGLVARVSSLGKLKKLMEVLQQEQIASELKEESGCQWAQVGRMLCAFNNGTFLLLQHKSGDANHIQGMLLSLMRQTDGEGFASLPEFQSLLEGENDVVATVDGSILPDEVTTPLRMGLSADIRLQDIRYLLEANFEPGKVKVDAHLLTRNEKVKGFIEKMDGVTTPLKGKYMDYFPGRTLAWWGGRVNGKSFYEMICQNPAIRQYVNNPVLPVDVERIFSAIEGDFGFGYLSAFSKEFLMYVDVTNRDFLTTFEELRPLLAMTGGEVKLHDTAEHQYALQTYDAVYWFGVKNGFFYVTNRQALAQEAGRTFGVSVGTRPWAKEVKEHRMYASFHFPSLLENLKYDPYLLSPLGSYEAVTAVKWLADQCVYLNVCMPNWSEGQLELVLKDKQANLLQELVNMWKEG